MAETFASGWENPDRHEPLSERPRPMYDEKGNPVTEAPPPVPEPGTELEDFLRPGDIQPAAGHTWHEHAERDRADVSVGALRAELSLKRRVLAIVEPALDDPSPAGWAVALEKVRELCS